jgi:hypothetical protein
MEANVTMVARKDGEIVLSAEWAGNLSEADMNKVINEVYSVVAKYGFGISLKLGEDVIM